MVASAFNNLYANSMLTEKGKNCHVVKSIKCRYLWVRKSIKHDKRTKHYKYHENIRRYLLKKFAFQIKGSLWGLQ